MNSLSLSLKICKPNLECQKVDVPRSATTVVVVVGRETAILYYSGFFALQNDAKKV